MLNLQQVEVTKHNKTIFTGVNFKVYAGDHILINGPSGAGKSTLLKTILFFDPISQGTISFEDELISVTNLDYFRSQIAYIGQKAPHFEGNVLDFIILPFSYKNNANINKPSTDEILKLCQMFSFDSLILERNYSSLSGGEQQRVSIIQALLLNKPIYLLDEITASLDPSNKQKVVNHLCSQKEKTLLIVSHDNNWQSAVNRTVTIENGKLQEVNHG